MKALTIRQPWAWLIVNGYKDVENRTWETNYRGFVFVHASASITKKEYNECYEFILERNLRVHLPPIDVLELGGIIGYTNIVNCDRSSDSRWFFGPVGFGLEGYGCLPFVPLKGSLGFFNVDIVRK